MPVILIGTLDTKGIEIAFLRDQLAERGVPALVLDAGIRGAPMQPADIPRETIFEAAGVSPAALHGEADKGRAIDIMAEGVRKVVVELHRQGKVNGVLGVGGLTSSQLSLAAMRSLPFGLPKLQVCTVPRGQNRPHLVYHDILTLFSFSDVSGINRISRTELSNAAHAMAGMVLKPVVETEPHEKPLIAATMFETTTRCVDHCCELIEARGYETMVFHATGGGGEAMESLISDGLVDGVIDLTTKELADYVILGGNGTGSERLILSLSVGVPQVLSVGGLDAITFGPKSSIPAVYKDRRFHSLNQLTTLMRTNAKESEKIGKEFGRRASASTGPTSVLLPLKGISDLDIEGGEFYDPEANAALFDAIRNSVSSSVEVIEMDVHLYDPAFAEALAEKLTSLVERD